MEYALIMMMKLRVSKKKPRNIKMGKFYIFSNRLKGNFRKPKMDSCLEEIRKENKNLKMRIQ